MITVYAKYKYGPKGKTPNVTISSEGIQVEAKTESAVVAALKKRWPTREILLLYFK